MQHTYHRQGYHDQVVKESPEEVLFDLRKGALVLLYRQKNQKLPAKKEEP